MVVLPPHIRLVDPKHVSGQRVLEFQITEPDPKPDDSPADLLVAVTDCGRIMVTDTFGYDPTFVSISDLQVIIDYTNSARAIEAHTAKLVELDQARLGSPAI